MRTTDSACVRPEGPKLYLQIIGFSLLSCFSSWECFLFKLIMSCVSGQALILVGWIQIRAKMIHKKFLIFQSAVCSHLRAEGFSCSLDILHGDLVI
jgi:hypothetical protein